MDREVVLFLENLRDIEVVEKASMTFFSGNLHGRRVVVAKSGIGKVNAAVCAQILIDHFKPEAVFCTGVAGALREDLDFGDTVISKDVVQYDVDATCFGHELGEIPNLGVKAFGASPRLIELAREVHEKTFKDKKVYIGRILTGDQFVCSKEKASFLKEAFEGSCVEMEGGAIAQVCYLNNMPFLIIRSISDKADGTAVSDYKSFADETAEKSFKLVSGVIEKYGEENK